MSENRRNHKGRLLLAVSLLLVTLVLHLVLISRLINVSALWPIDDGNKDGYLISSSYFLTTITLLLTLWELFTRKKGGQETRQSQQKDLVQEATETIDLDNDPEHEEQPHQGISSPVENVVKQAQEKESEVLVVSIPEDGEAVEPRNKSEVNGSVDEGEDTLEGTPVEYEVDLELDDGDEAGYNLHMDDNPFENEDAPSQGIVGEPSVPAPNDGLKGYKISSFRHEELDENQVEDSELVKTLNEFEHIVEDLRNRIRKK